MEGNLVITLPECLVHSLLTEWVDVIGQVRLDSAFCMRNFQPKLRLYFAVHDWHGIFTKKVAFRGGFKYKDACKWVLSRGLRTTQIYIQGETGCEEVIEQLVIRNAQHLKRATVGNERIIQCIGENCVRLESLTCAFCFPGPPFETLLLNNPSLSELHLAPFRFHNVGAMLGRIHCPSVTKFCFRRDITIHLADLVVQAFPNLTDLTVSAILDKALKVITVLPLQALTLMEIASLDGAIFGDCLEDHCFSELRELNVHCWTEDAVISSLFSHSPMLHTIRLGNNYNDGNIQGRSILTIVSSYIGERLEVLEMEFVHDLPDKSLHVLSLRCPHLRELVIKNCDNDFTEKTVLKLLSRCKMLTKLHIHTLKCTDVLLQAIVTHCPCMQSLVFDCGELDVDQNQLVSFIQQAKSLKELTLGTAEFPGDGIVFADTYCRHLTFTVGSDDG